MVCSFRDVAQIVLNHETVDGRPFTGISSSIDVPDDFFRIRLVCALLDTCGMCFDRGHQKRRLDQFLNFFQAGNFPDTVQLS
jgi:regulator of nonsense transcripts 2